MTQHIDIGRLAKILDGVRPVRENLIPVLQAIQDEFGYVPPETIRPAAEHLGVFPSEISGITSFYAQFYMTPRGRNVVRVCRVPLVTSVAHGPCFRRWPGSPDLRTAKLRPTCSSHLRRSLV